MIELKSKPLITSQSGDIGDNINGPSVIEVPDWVTCPLGRYYMYFAHHSGAHIRLAYADQPLGPWTMSSAIILPIDEIKDSSPFHHHIASPDVHVDHEQQLIRLYFHAPSEWPEVEARGRLKTKFSQLTGCSNSKDGLDFQLDGTTPISFAYLRLFHHDDVCYGISSRALLFRSEQKWPRGDRTMVERDRELGSLRHAAVHLSGDDLYVFYSRWGDAPERLVVSKMSLKGDWQSWELSPPVAVTKPDTEVEGANLPLAPSQTGAAKSRLNELRDPHYFECEEGKFLYYCYAGESGISAVKLQDNWEELVNEALTLGNFDEPDQ